MYELSTEKLLNEIPIIDSNINYWLVRTNGGDFYTDFSLNNYVGIGYNRISLKEIKDVTNSTEALKTIILDKYSEEEQKGDLSQPGKIAGQLLRFTERLKENDYIVIPSEASQFFYVGVVSGEPYELTDQQLEQKEVTINYKKSNYKKRIPVRWLGKFDRDKADSSLYKMIFSQQTLADINSYRSFINRALFPVYIEDGTLHLTFNVANTETVNGRHLGQFIYYYTTIYELLFPDEIMDVRVNVQSPGPIESITKNAKKGIVVFGILAFLTSAPYGGSFKVGNEFFGTVEITLPGLINGHTDVQVKRSEIASQNHINDQQLLENIKTAIEMAIELRVPITELGIEFPEGLEDSIQEEVNKKIAEEEKKENPNSRDSQELENVDLDEGSDENEGDS